MIDTDFEHFLNTKGATMPQQINASTVTDQILAMSNKVSVISTQFKPVQDQLLEQVQVLLTSTNPEHRKFAGDQLRSEVLPKLTQLFLVLKTELASAERFLQHIPKGPIDAETRFETVDSQRVPQETFEAHQRELDKLGTADDPTPKDSDSDDDGTAKAETEKKNKE